MPARWNDAEMFTFLDMYQKHECLWNPKNEQYRNNKIRENSLRAIIKNIGKPDLTESDLKSKIKNIRTTYKRELSKVLQSKKSGAETDNIYEPILVWFKKADSFLRGITEDRSNRMSERSESQPKPATADESLFDDVSESPAEEEEVAIPTQFLSTKMTAPKRKFSRDSNTIEDAIDILDTISKRQKEDEFQTFAKHVANQLRHLPLEQALLCQNEIQSILTRERIRALNSEHCSQSNASSSNVSSNCFDFA